MSLIDLEDFKDVLGVGDIYPDAQLESAMTSAENIISWILKLSQRVNRCRDHSIQPSNIRHA
jgi:hypothetical protein